MTSLKYDKKPVPALRLYGSNLWLPRTNAILTASLLEVKHEYLFFCLLLFPLGRGDSFFRMWKINKQGNYRWVLIWTSQFLNISSIRLSYLAYTSYLDYFFVIWLIHTLSFEDVDPLDCEKFLRLVNLDWYIAFSYIAFYISEISCHKSPPHISR